MKFYLPFFRRFLFTIIDMLVFNLYCKSHKSKAAITILSSPMCLRLTMKNIVKHIKVVNIITIKNVEQYHFIVHIYFLNICVRSWNRRYMTWFTILVNTKTMFTNVMLKYWKQNYQMIFVWLCFFTAPDTYPFAPMEIYIP